MALSSAEAEYMALTMIIKMMLWIINIIEAIPGQFIRRPIHIYEDNRPSLTSPTTMQLRSTPDT